MTDGSRPVVAIFVKTPGLSPIKTRLARDLGARAAESIYLDCVACVRSAVGVSGLPHVWAVAEAEAAGRPPWDDAPCRPQPDGNLGERMAGVFRALRARAPGVLLIGGDLPQLDPAALRTASDWLGTPDRHVFGPAADGGFWLYGSSAEDPTANWSGVPYSRPETGARFREAIGGRPERWQTLAPATDLDRADDLAPVVAELRALADARPEQRRLADRLAGIMTP